MYKKCTANSSIKKMDINTKKMKKAKIMPTVHTGTCAHTCTSSTYMISMYVVACAPVLSRFTFSTPSLFLSDLNVQIGFEIQIVRKVLC